MILFFDTETSGLPKDWNAPVSELDNWPRLVQIAWILCDYNGNRIESEDFIIIPESFKIPTESTKVHGITTKEALNEGISLNIVLNRFNSLIEKSDIIVAHNIAFDEKIIGAEFLRKGITSILDDKRKICTMKSSTDFCKIPGNYGYKWPKLSELHIKLFGEDFNEAHDASVDINATEKCFWELIRLKVLELNIQNNNTKANNIPVLDNLEEYIKQNNIQNIPLAPVAKALIYLDTKLTQTLPHDTIKKEIEFLNDIYTVRNDALQYEYKMNSKQSEFISLLNGKIISKYNESSILNKEHLKTVEDKKRMLHTFGLMATPKDKEIVPILYKYYVELYLDFIINNNSPLLELNEFKAIALKKHKNEPNSNCYIATMAYGDINHPNVILFRLFRDKILSTHTIGRYFIKLYYLISPYLVRFCIKNHNIVNHTRKFLDYLLENYIKIKI